MAVTYNHVKNVKLSYTLLSHTYLDYARSSILRFIINITFKKFASLTIKRFKVNLYQTLKNNIIILKANYFRLQAIFQVSTLFRFHKMLHATNIKNKKNKRKRTVLWPMFNIKYQKKTL